MTAQAAPARTVRFAWLPTALTVFRIAAAPVIAAIIIWAGHVSIADRPLAALLYLVAAALFAVTALTDWLDGALARRWNVVSPLGAALDHCADKVLTSSALAALCYYGLSANLVIAAVLLIGRDAFVGGLREALAGTGRAPAVSWMGKWKAAAAMIGIVAVLLERYAFLADMPNLIYYPAAWGGRVFLWAAVAMALVSAWEYATTAVTAVKAPAAKSKVFD